MLEGLQQSIDERVQDWVDQFREHVNPTFMKLLQTLGYGRLYVKAKDVHLWDSQQRCYLDALAGFGTMNIGHNHPQLLARLQEFLQDDPMQFCHIGPSPYQADLASALAQRLPGDLAMVLFANGGADAVETGLKIAQAATGRSQLLYCQGGYHGTSLGTLSIMGAQRMRKPFASVLARSTEIPFNDLTALEQQLIQKKIAAFIVEPVQAEAGVQLPAADYLRQAQQLCRQQGTLFIVDEIQTGIGRTGHFVYSTAAGLEPDVLLLGKSLGGGIAPIACAVTTPGWFKKAFGSLDRFDLTSSTFAGGALACVAALATLQIVGQQALAQQARDQGSKLCAELKQSLAQHPLVREVRGEGLLIAIELGAGNSDWLGNLSNRVMSLATRNVEGQWIACELLNAGIVCQPAAHRWNVLKLTPPLTLQDEQRKLLHDTLVAVLSRYTSMAQIIKAVTRQLARSQTAKQQDMY